MQWRFLGPQFDYWTIPAAYFGYCSNEDYARKERVALASKDIPLKSFAGFVTCLQEENWWLACVLEVCSDTKEMKLTFLHPHGPPNWFKYPEPQNYRTIPMDGILTLVDPMTRSGRVYSMIDRNDLCYQTASHCSTTVINLYYMPLSQLVYV